MASKWADYGFPDNLHLAKPELVARGLLLALKERYAALGGNISDLETRLNISPLMRRNVAFPTVFGSGITHEPFCRTYDSYLGILGFYYNHTSPVSNIERYTLQSIAAAAGIGDDFINSLYEDKYRLTPHFQIKWAIQRYKILNMMRRCITAQPILAGEYYAAQRRTTNSPAWDNYTGSSYAASYSNNSFSQSRCKQKYQWNTDASNYTFGTGVVAQCTANQNLAGTVFINGTRYIEVDDWGNMQGLASGEYFDINEYYLESDLDTARTAPEGFYVNAYIFPRICGDVEGGFEFLDIEESEE